MPVTSYSRTPADNNQSPPNGWPEGQAAASVNNCARQMMTDIVNEATKGQARVLASVAGTNTITATMTPDLDAYAAGMIVVCTPANNNTGATTLNIDSLGALDIQKADGDALVSGDLVAGIPAVLVLDSGADDWILLNPMTHNVTGLDATGNVSVGGTLSVTGAITLNGALTTDNTTADETGFKGLPKNTQNAYTCVLSDAGKCIEATTNGTTITIPANASVAYPIGTALTFLANTTANISIAITSDALYLAATGFATSGTRTLAAGGIATAYKYASTSWLISGTGLS